MSSKYLGTSSNSRGLSLFAVVFSVLLMNIAPLDTLGQKPPVSNPKSVSIAEINTTPKQPDKGYLSLRAVREAQVTLTPSNKGKVINKKITENNTLNLVNLSPGKYKVDIKHPDYRPYSEEVIIVGGELVSPDFSEKLISIYGKIVIGGDLQGATVLLDGKKLDIKLEGKDMTISRVPVGKHKLKISKEKYEDFDAEREVKPNDPTIIAAEFKLATVTVTLESEPGAKIYVKEKEGGTYKEEKSTVQPDRKVAVSLLPGSYTVRVTKEGYDDREEDITLSLKESNVTKIFPLSPTPESVEGDWEPSLKSEKWFPKPPGGWDFDKTGAHISKDMVALFATETKRDFNIYKDFQFEFDVRLVNGKGVAWVARAKDKENYYLFELKVPQGDDRAKFNFYICQNGKCEFKDSRQIDGKIETPGASLHIIFNADKDQFQTSMEISTDPKHETNIIGSFNDPRFTLGGIGFRGKDGIEMLLQSFNVRPKK